MINNLEKLLKQLDIFQEHRNDILTIVKCLMYY